MPAITVARDVFEEFNAVAFKEAAIFVTSCSVNGVV